jgi:hypothetical protein
MVYVPDFFVWSVQNVAALSDQAQYLKTNISRVIAIMTI